MAKDMYPKRRERKIQKENNQDNGVTKTNTNCVIQSYGNSYSNLYK